MHKFRDTKFGGDQPHVEYLPIGATGPEHYRDELKIPPTLRQVRLIIAARGIETTIALLKQWRAQEPAAPIFEDDFGFALVDECLGQARIANAIAINRFYSDHNPKFSKIFVRTGEGYRKAGLRSFAQDYFRKACLLDPGDTAAAARCQRARDAHEKMTPSGPGRTAVSAFVFGFSLDVPQNGDVAQLGERLVCNQEVGGSIPVVST